MSVTARVLLLTAAWQFPLGWTVLWGIFRGAYAHGGYRWWQHAHHGGLLLLGLAAWAAHRRYGGPMHAREQVMLVAVLSSVLLLANASAGETTAVVVFIADGEVSGASVGDSGAWLIVGEQILELTGASLENLSLDPVKRIQSRSAVCLFGAGS